MLAEPELAKPAYLTPIFPEPFDLKVTRVADDAGRVISFRAGGVGRWGSDARHHYSNDQPWSADGTLLALQNNGSPGYVYLDGETYQPVRGPCPNYDYYDDRWHPSLAHAHERINVNRTSTLSWFDVVTCTATRSWTLPLAVIGIGGNPSDDGRFVEGLALSDGGDVGFFFGCGGGNRGRLRRANGDHGVPGFGFIPDRLDTKLAFVQSAVDPQFNRERLGLQLH